MKRFLILFCLIRAIFLFAEEYPLVVVKQYPQDYQKGMFLAREESNPELIAYDKPQGSPDFFTAQYLCIDEKGKLYVYQTNTSRMMYLNETYEIENTTSFNLVNNPWRICCNNGSFYVDSYYGAFRQFDLRGNLINHVVLSNVIKTNGGEYQFYYDEQCDVLFFRDKKSQLYSIEHPSMDDATNKANFKGPDETIKMLNSGKYVPHLTVRQEINWQNKNINNLYIDGLLCRWGSALEHNKYIISIVENQKYINVYDSVDREEIHFQLQESEELESSAIHPCGDCYILSINWNTNTHILYRIENTWDPEWRASWYAEHPDAPGQELPSGNVAQAAASTVRTGYLNDDRIRLRKGPGTGTDSLGTYPINTTFTILENSGVMQTIDGVTDEWIKVRLSDGTEGYFYGQYVSEK